MLTGQAKKNFEMWLYKNYQSYYRQAWGLLPISAQQGMVLEWFDGACIYIDVQPWADFEDTDTYQKTIFITNVSYVEGCQMKMFEGNFEEELYPFQTRKQGIEKGVKIANKIYNER